MHTARTRLDAKCMLSVLSSCLPAAPRCARPNANGREHGTRYDVLTVDNCRREDMTWKRAITGQLRLICTSPRLALRSLEIDVRRRLYGFLLDERVCMSSSGLL